MDSKHSTLRTSTSDPIRVDFLPFPLPGRVGLTFAPGKCDGCLHGVMRIEAAPARLSATPQPHLAVGIPVAVADPAAAVK